MRRLLLLALLIPGLTIADDALDDAFDRDVLIIAASRYACYRFDIWLAIERQQQLRGLMHVREMPDTSGMLFVYAEASYQSMWMKNTFIPLDMVFARADGTIANIARDTVPQSLESVGSTEPVNYVLELNAGTTERLFIDDDSRLYWGPMYGNDN